MKGWRYDSYRHLLASKGIRSLKSNKYFATDMSPAIGSEEPSERLEEEEREGKISQTQHYCDVHKINYTGDRCPEEASLKTFEKSKEAMNPKWRVIW
jgi:hypothetical protein